MFGVCIVEAEVERTMGWSLDAEACDEQTKALRRNEEAQESG